MTRALVMMWSREVRRAVRQPAAWLQPLVFFTVVCVMFALGTSPQATWMRQAAPAVLWMGALLACLLSLESAFRAELESGWLEQLLLSNIPAPLWIVAKLAGLWTVVALPLTVIAPVLGAMLGLDRATLAVLGLSLLLGLPALVLLTGFASALTVALPRAGLLLPVVILPLVCPLVIFGAGAVRMAAAGQGAEAPLYFLSALLVLSLTLAPPAVAAALRLSYD